MVRNTLILVFCLLLVSVKSVAQTIVFPGTWQLEYQPNPGMSPIYMELQIGFPEKNILYPAQLTLQCDSFTANYHMLLVKKTSRELAISRNKYPLFEKPFSLGKQTFFLNGIFDYSRDLKGETVLNLGRMQSKYPVVPIPDTINLNERNKLTAIQLINFLKNADIKLTRVNNAPWKDEKSDLILSPALSPAYFGLLDTIHLPVRDGIIKLAGNRKNDMVSIAMNGQTIIDKLALNKKLYTEDILLDTGLNLLILFADNFGNELPNKAKLNLAFRNKKINLDFTNKADSAASFIVAKIYCDQDKEKDVYFRDNIPSLEGDKTLQSNEKLIGSIIATSQQITLAIWDDAVEDGDSISININDKWIVRGFPVKKNPQFISVELNTGANVITFIADNLGSIPPNTSILEIIDGKRRKSFTLATSPGENNLIKIFYDLKAN